MQKKKLPPGQTITKNFPILHVGEVPLFNMETWDFFVDGEVENPIKIGWEAFNKLPEVKQMSDFHCVTGWSRFGDEGPQSLQMNLRNPCGELLWFVLFVEKINPACITFRQQLAHSLPELGVH